MTDKFTLFVYCNLLVLLSTTVCSQNINKNTMLNSRRNFYRLQLSQLVSVYEIKELFIKTISNSSLNSHVYWDTLYIQNYQIDDGIAVIYFTFQTFPFFLVWVCQPNCEEHSQVINSHKNNSYLFSKNKT